MIEEETLSEMDRKNSNRTSSVPPKSNGGQESKKSENGNGGRYPRHNKKREPTGSRPRPENGVVRKPVPQKSRASTDKRPRSRGLFGDRQREEVSQVEDRAVYGCAQQKAPRKANLNHLLNFTYAPRDGFDGVSGRGAGFYGRGPRRGHYRNKYNKEQFLQANCQFIVREGEDYSVHSADPDRLVDWDLIEQVRVCSSELPSCPICLYPPVAAKITKCGHIYCSACVLHYLALGEKNWRKCPICYEAIHKGHLKSVQTKCKPSYKVGEEITFQLMKKEKGSTMVLPKSFWTQREGQPLSVNDELVSVTTGLVVASEEEVRQMIIEPERRALEHQLSTETEASEICFMESALALLEERVQQLKGSREVKEEVQKVLQPVEDLTAAADDIEVSPTKIVHDLYTDAFADEEIQGEDEDKEELAQGEVIDEAMAGGTELDENGNSGEVSEGSPELPADRDEEEGGKTLPGEEEGGKTLPEEEAIEYLAVEESPKPESRNLGNPFYYFYQAKDGQHIYIHAVNARCLGREYGSLENCPETLTATVVEIESVFMTEELRRRLRYLCHLPLTCEFKVAEVVLKPPLLSKDTLNFFAGEIERRHRLRQKKNRDERKRTKKIQEEEQLKQGFYPGLRIPLSSAAQFPTTQAERTHGSSSPSSSSSHSTPLTSPTSAHGLNVFASEFVPGSVGSTASTSPASWGSESGTLSFASMLKEGKAMPKVWPKPGKTDIPAPPGGVASSGRRPDSDESDPEDKVPVPEFHSAFEDAIQQAFDNLSKNKGVDEIGKPVETGPGRKKKKQKKLLFTTTMTRGK